MTQLQRIQEYLSSHPDLCDDCLGRALGIDRHRVNAVCNGSSTIKRVEGICRGCKEHKIVRSLNDDLPVLPIAPQLATGVRPWTWEGNVQNTIAEYLRGGDWEILAMANTRTKETGIDIRASKGGASLLISVKGFPTKTPKTSPNTQARHCFSEALFDMIRYRQQYPKAQLGIGLPDGYKTYQNLVPKCSWFQAACGFTFYWVKEDGAVRTTV